MTDQPAHTSNPPNSHEPNNGAHKLQPEFATLYRAAVSFGTQETQLIWTRYTGFLLLNGFFVNALVQKWTKSTEPELTYLFLFIGAATLVVNALWHMLNFAGWMNEQWFYFLAANIDKSLSRYELPTRFFSTRRLPYGSIYWLAQFVPTGFSIGGAVCLVFALEGFTFATCAAWLIAAGVLIMLALLVYYAEYHRMAKALGENRPL